MLLAVSISYFAPQQLNQQIQADVFELTREERVTEEERQKEEEKQKEGANRKREKQTDTTSSFLIQRILSRLTQTCNRKKQIKYSPHDCVL